MCIFGQNHLAMFRLHILLFLRLVVLNASAQLPSNIPSDSLIAWFPLNGNGIDEGPNSIGFDYFSATPTENRFGESNSALSFNGVNDWIQGNSEGFPDADRTIAFWAKFQKNGTELWLTGYGGGALGTSTIVYANSGQCGMSNQLAHSEHGCQGVFSVPFSALPDDEWIHIALTSNSTVAKFYINGIPSASRSGLGSVNTNAFYYIGACPDYTGVSMVGAGAFTGSLDDVGIWNRALNDAEILQLANDTISSSGPGCTDFAACNFYPNATEDDGSCTYPEHGRDCAGECLGGTSWYVDDAAADGAGTGELLNPFSTIQEALELACPGDMVLISPGTYIENVNLTADDVTVKATLPLCQSTR